MIGLVLALYAMVWLGFSVQALEAYSKDKPNQGWVFKTFFLVFAFLLYPIAIGKVVAKLAVKDADK